MSPATAFAMARASCAGGPTSGRDQCTLEQLQQEARPSRPVRDTKGSNRPHARGVIVSDVGGTRSPILARGTRLAVGIALGSAAIARLPSRWPGIPKSSGSRRPRPPPSIAVLVLEGEDLARLGNCAGCHTADPARPLAGGRALADAVRHGIRHQHHARCRDRHRRAGRARPSIGRCGAASRRNGEHLYPAFPYDHFTHASDERARRALCLADDAATRSRAARPRRSSPASSASGRWSPPGTCSTWTKARCRPIRPQSPTGIAAARWPKAWPLRRLPHAAQPLRRRGQERAPTMAPDRRLVRAAAQRALAGRAAVDGGRAARLSAHRPRAGHAAAAGPMGGVPARCPQVPRRRRARDRRLCRLADGGAPAARAGHRPSRSIGRPSRSRRIPRRRTLVRRRLRGLPRARRADDAAGPAAARLGHAAARRTIRTTRCASS